MIETTPASPLPSNSVMTEPVRPFSMPPHQRAPVNPGMLLVAVLLSLMLASGGLLAWFAVASHEGSSGAGAVTAMQGEGSLRFASEDGNRLQHDSER